MVFTNWLNLEPGGYNLFALSKDVITNIGYFDENFFPVNIIIFITIFIFNLLFICKYRLFMKIMIGIEDYNYGMKVEYKHLWIYFHGMVQEVLK